jgi:hypothetical protein
MGTQPTIRKSVVKPMSLEPRTEAITWPPFWLGQQPPASGSQRRGLAEHHLLAYNPGGVGVVEWIVGEG